ncbi:hypothetical protein [Rhizobium sp. Root149]|uniref:hypothetical protein n=1 Tax=Rhizobium sp. Root149 TaxID=1736473 RepID=UPI000AAA3FF8|nr:hypothetical protein [Rhizobium sp. Root149]
MTRSSRDTKGISFDTVEWFGAGIGAKAPVPPIASLRSGEAAKAIGRFVRVRVCQRQTARRGFRLADARWRTGLARCGSIELHPFHHRIARANRETELTPSLPEVL